MKNVSLLKWNGRGLGSEMGVWPEVGWVWSVIRQGGCVHRLGECGSRSLILHISITAAVFFPCAFVRHCSSPVICAKGLSS